MAGWRPGAGREKRIAALLCALAIVAGLTLSLRVVPYQVDDAYIAYRYALNLAEGEGPTYNAGQPPVEGFSSPLWLIGLSLAARAGGHGSLPWAATAAGLLSFLATLAVLGSAGRRACREGSDADGGRACGEWGDPAEAEKGQDGAAPPGIGADRQAADPGAIWAATFSIGTFALLPTAVSYAVTGLETLLFAAVVGAFAGAAAGALPLGYGLAAGAMALWVRPEGAWLPVAMVAQLAGMGALARLRERRTAVLVLAVVLGGASVVALRVAVFGEILPNTWYAKEAVLAEGLAYAGKTMLLPPFLALLACGVLGAWLGGRMHAGYVAGGLAWVAAAVIEGGDWMPGGRLLLPAFALFSLAAGGMAGACRQPGWRSRSAWVAAAATVLLHAQGSWSFTESGARALDTYRHEARVVADWVRRSGAKSIGLIDIGEMGFRTGVEILDLAGLTDPVIGRAPGRLMEKEFDLGYVFEERVPDLLLVRLSRVSGSATGGPPEALPPVHPADAMSRIEMRLLADERLGRSYKPQFLQVPARPRRLLNARLVYIRRGVALDESVSAVKGVVTVQPPESWPPE